MILKYINLHTLAAINLFPQILWSLPLDDMLYNNIFKYYETTFYDYSDVNSDSTTIITSKIAFSLIPDFAAVSSKPPKNFKRIKFLAYNRKYTVADYDLASTVAISLPANCQYAFDDLMCFVCNVNRFLSKFTFY